MLLSGRSILGPENEIDVVGHIQVQIAVAVVVGPGTSGAEALVVDPRFFGDISKSAVTEVFIQHVVPEGRHVEILIAIVVVVTPGSPHAEPDKPDARSVGDVFESFAGQITVETPAAVRRRRGGVRENRSAKVDKVEIVPTVVVEITDGHPRPHILRQERFALNLKVAEVNSHLFGDVLEPKRHRPLADGPI